MLELYHSPVSTCSQRVRQALAEKQLEWIDREINLSANEHLSPAYLQLNPNGLVPTLVHDGQVIPDSSVILEYLEDVFPEPPLRPTSAADVAKMRAWVRYIDEVPTAAARYPSFQLAFGKRLMALPEEERKRVALGRPLRAAFYDQIGPGGFDENAMRHAMRQLEQCFDRLEDALDDGPWVMGQAFGIVDISILPTVVRMEDLGLQHFYASRENVADWYGRIRERPSFAEAYYPKSRISVAAGAVQA